MFANTQSARSNFRAFALCLIADCAFLPLSDLEDDWSEGESQDAISEVMDSIRDGLVSTLIRVANIGRPDPDSEYSEDPHERDRIAHYYLSMVCRTMSGRAFFITQNGHTGIAPDDIEVGDHVTVLHGCRTPLILRQDELLDKCWIIGDAYVDGFMKGEVAELPRES
jgi:hypothetical protein